MWAASLVLAQNSTPPQPGSLPPVKTSITVTEQVEAEAPAETSILGKTEIREQAGVNLDDRLRVIPGFSLFRRSSSLVANPTTQGISLRGLGSSGVSRTLVLWDGVPLNDPFGGWIYWTRIDPEDLDRVEVTRGSTTSAFGDRALSGTIGLFSRPAERRRLTGSYEGGNRDTNALTAGFSDLWSRFAALIDARAVKTDGYFTVPANVRGSADRPASVEFVAGTARIDYLASDDHLFMKMDVLAEERQNGTALTNNSTSLGTLSANYGHQWTSDTLSVLAYHSREQYHSSFSSVLQNRNVERLTYLQTVPSQATGGAGFWSHKGSFWNVLGGADLEEISGTSTDHLIPSGLRIGSGSQFQHGLFGQSTVHVGGLQLFGGARHQFTGQGHEFLSPNAGVAFGKRRWKLRGSVYRSFRAPTLNELYRDFRVGNATTEANPRLVPEHVFGAEAGVDFSTESAHFSLTLYRNALQDIVTNVTLSSTRTEIIRQRQNASSALGRGVDIEAHKSWGAWQGQIGYLFADSHYAAGPRIAQVPRHQGGGQLTYHRSGTFVTAGVRSYSAQFEDDLNQFVLPGFASVQMTARQKITSQLSALASVENLLDRQYLVGFSPTPLIGSPRLWRVGLRWDGLLR